MKNNKAITIILIVLNAMVLLGQLCPEGAPPFASAVNLLFLVSSLLYFIVVLINAKKS